MNTTECRSLKRKVDKSQHHGGGRSKIAKEASTEILTTSMHLVMLRDNDWTCLDSSPSPWEENTSAKISEREENEDGSISCGVMWKGSDTNQLESTLLQVCLDCKREANGKKFNCETQMFYCFPVTSTREVLIPEIGCQTATSKQATSTSRNLKNIKQEVQDQDCTSHPLVCCVRGCESRSDEVDPSVSFYTVPSDEEQKLLWTELFDIVPDYQRLSHHHVCSRHFMTPKQLPVTKTKTRKKKTCDMLLAEEAEKIKQGLAAGRPKRTPKPNKNYDWAELATFIKTEVDTPDEMDLIPVSKTSTRSLGLATRQRKQPFASVKKEDKENESPSPDADTSVFENADEYGENVSLPSHPRAPPPKPKGRPHRIRDICTQTDVLPSSSLKIPLREVKVQCNLTNEPLVSCPTCSIINWMRLEELLIDCLSKIERVFHDPLLSICLDKVLGNIEEPNHATNVLKLLSGMERDLLESPKDIILVSSQDEEVEIENVIHPEVEAPVTGVREITPKLWQAKVKLKTEDDDDEEVLKVDPDGLGLQEATELDDEEFQPDFPDADEDEDEEQELDDEEWSISRRDSDSGVSSKRKQKKMQLRHKKEPGDNRSPCEVKECWPSFMEPRDTSQRRSGSSASTEDPQSGFYAGSLEKNRSHTNAWLQKKCRSERVGTLRSNTGSHGVCESPQGSGPHRKMSYRQNMSDRQDVSDSGGSTRSARYSCDECGKVFTQRQAVRYHKVWRHNAERRGPCPHCHYKAPDTTKLRLHIKKVHRGYMPYKCRFCPKQFKCHSNHKEHEARHQGEGDFECHLCDKKFALQSSLARHVRYHKGERPFCCHHCGKSFKSKPHLQRHITCLHLKEKRVVCEVCGAAHHNNWNLKIHMKTHQVSDHNREHICSHCGSQFKNSSSLMVHIRKVHTVTVVQSSKTADVEVQTPESSGKQLTSIFEEPARKTKDELAHQEDTEGSLIVIGEVLSSTPPQMTEHRTIVIDGGSQDNLQQLPEGFAYNDFTEDSSMHTLELYSCDACFMVFQSEGELLQHNCTHTFTTSY